MGSLQISCFSTDFLGTNLSTSVNFTHLFPNLSKLITFSAALLVLAPFVRNQPVPPLWGVENLWRSASPLWSGTRPHAINYIYKGHITCLHVVDHIYRSLTTFIRNQRTSAAASTRARTAARSPGVAGRGGGCFSVSSCLF